MTFERDCKDPGFQHYIGALSLLYPLREISNIKKDIPDFSKLYTAIKEPISKICSETLTKLSPLSDPDQIEDIFKNLLRIILNYNKTLLTEEEPLLLDCPLQSFGLTDGHRIPQGYVYYPKPLFYSEDTLFPIKFKENLRKEVEDSKRELLQLLHKELTLTFNQYIDFPLRFFSLIYSLLWRYLWCLPTTLYSNGSLYYSSKISFFEFLRLYSVLVLSLLSRYNLDQISDNTSLKDEFLLSRLKLFHIKGDISGIQNFINSTLNITGTARILRGKSFFLSILDRLSSNYLLRRLGYPSSHIIFSSGGHFEILIGYDIDIQRKIKELTFSIEKYLISSFCGELGLIVVGESYSLLDLLTKGYGEVIGRVLYAVGEAKKRKFLTFLSESSSDDVIEELNRDFLKGRALRVCPACGKYLIVENQEETCQWCEAFFKLGKELPEARYLVIYLKEDEDRAMKEDVEEPLMDEDSFDFGPLGKITLLREAPPLRNTEDNKRVILLNDTRLILGQRVLADTFMAVEQHIPYCQERAHIGDPSQATPRTFEELAKHSKGDDKLAYVKGDLDNLGQLLQRGLKNSNLWFVISTLSTHLDLFFSGYLRYLLSTSTYRNSIYTLYAGGDDFLLIGSWNEALRFLHLIREKFYYYTGQNDNLHFSAGVTLTAPHYPVRLSLDLVQEALGEAKERKPAVHLFNETVSWEAYGLLFTELTGDISRCVEEEKIGRSFLYKIYQLIKQYRIYDIKKDIKKYRFYPLFFYYLNRNVQATDVKRMLVEWLLNPEEEFKIREEALVKLKYVLTLTRRR